MQPIQSTANQALRILLDSQPTSAAKVTFVWTMAAGPALARATEVDWRAGGVLVVRARSDAWRAELRRARPMLLDRVRSLAGPDVVQHLVIE